MGIPVHTLCHSVPFHRGMEICPTLWALGGNRFRRFLAHRPEGIRLLWAGDFDEMIEGGQLLKEPLRFDDPIKAEREFRPKVLAWARKLDKDAASACTTLEKSNAVAEYVSDDTETKVEPTDRDKAVLKFLEDSKVQFCADESSAPGRVTFYALYEYDGSDHRGRMRMHWYANIYRRSLEHVLKAAGSNVGDRCQPTGGRLCAEPRIVGPFAPVQELGHGWLNDEDMVFYRMDLDAGMKNGDLANGRYGPEAAALEKKYRMAVLKRARSEEDWAACGITPAPSH
jgi:hypothetical protein